MSQSRKIALLLADVDGTLLTPGKVLTARACKAVHYLHRAGIRFAITSARPPRGMAMLAEPLSLDMPIAGFNGGLFVHPDLTIIEECLLAPDAARQAASLIAKHGLGVWVFCGNDWLVRDAEAPHVEREVSAVQFRPKTVKDFEGAFQRAAKIVGVSDDLERVKACEADVHTALGRRASATRSQPYYLDVTHPDANKGCVAKYFSRTLGVPAEEIATIGDSAERRADVQAIGLQHRHG